MKLLFIIFSCLLFSVSHSEECTVYGNGQDGEECQFPFTYLWGFAQYNECTDLFHHEYWCKTASGHWGNCNPGCPGVPIYDYVNDAGQTCILIETVTSHSGNEVSWNIGGCSSHPDNDDYLNMSKEQQYCCFETAGDHFPESMELNCIDEMEDGWHGGYVTIMERDYCHDFGDGHSKTVTVDLSEVGETHVGGIGSQKAAVMARLERASQAENAVADSQNQMLASHESEHNEADELTMSADSESLVGPMDWSWKDESLLANSIHITAYVFAIIGVFAVAYGLITRFTAKGKYSSIDEEVEI